MTDTYNTLIYIIQHSVIMFICNMFSTLPSCERVIFTDMYYLISIALQFQFLYSVTRRDLNIYLFPSVLYVLAKHFPAEHISYLSMDLQGFSCSPEKHLLSLMSVALRKHAFANYGPILL